MTLVEFALLALAVGIFIVLAALAKLPVSLSLAASAVVLALAAGDGLPLGMLFEGSFGYLDVGLVLVAAMIFMKAIEANGLLGELTRAIVVAFGRSPLLLLVALCIVVMFPGAITGSCTASVLGTGALVAPVLVEIGLPLPAAGAFISCAAVYGMIAPPVNVLVMIIGGGIDLPYIGFDLILLLVALPLSIITCLALGLGHVDRTKVAAVVERRRGERRKGGVIAYLPLIVLLALMIGPKALPGRFPDLRLPLAFLIATAVAVFTGERFDIVKAAREGTSEILPVVGILFGVGMFIEVLTLTGLRGAIVVGALSLPKALMLAGVAIILPLFGGISVYGGASVLGVPFALAFLGSNQIVVLSALSLIGAMGSFLPPVALTPAVTAKLIGEARYLEITKRCLVPAAFGVGAGVLMLVYAGPIAKFLGV